LLIAPAPATPGTFNVSTEQNAARSPGLLMGQNTSTTLLY